MFTYTMLGIHTRRSSVVSPATSADVGRQTESSHLPSPDEIYELRSQLLCPPHPILLLLFKTTANLARCAGGKSDDNGLRSKSTETREGGNLTTVAALSDARGQK